MARNARHLKILEIIAERPVETQEELANALVAAGFNVTQATVSRDIKELGLVKVAENGKQHYERERFNNTNVTMKFRDMCRHSVVTVECSANLVVIRTLSGSANIVAIMVDRLNYGGVLGCVAGDDTVFVACRDENSAGEVKRMLSEIAAG